MPLPTSQSYLGRKAIFEMEVVSVCMNINQLEQIGFLLFVIEKKVFKSLALLKIRWQEKGGFCDNYSCKKRKLS